MHSHTILTFGLFILAFHFRCQALIYWVHYDLCGYNLVDSIREVMRMGYLGDTLLQDANNEVMNIAFRRIFKTPTTNNRYRAAV